MLAVKDKDASLKDSLADLLAVLQENCSVAPGSEKIVWQRSASATSDRIVLTFELPGFAQVADVSIAFCHNLKVDKELSQLPQRITLEVGPSLSEMISCGDMSKNGIPFPNLVKKNGSKTGSVQLYSSYLGNSLGVVRNIRIGIVVPSTANAPNPPLIVLSKFSLKVFPYLAFFIC
jgi:hypothetical protein